MNGNKYSRYSLFLDDDSRIVKNIQRRAGGSRILQKWTFVSTPRGKNCRRLDGEWNSSHSKLRKEVVTKANKARPNQAPTGRAKSGAPVSLCSPSASLRENEAVEQRTPDSPLRYVAGRTASSETDALSALLNCLVMCDNFLFLEMKILEF